MGKGSQLYLKGLVTHDTTACAALAEALAASREARWIFEAGVHWPTAAHFPVLRRGLILSADAPWMALAGQSWPAQLYAPSLAQALVRTGNITSIRQALMRWPAERRDDAIQCTACALYSGHLRRPFPLNHLPAYTLLKLSECTFYLLIQNNLRSAMPSHSFLAAAEAALRDWCAHLRIPAIGIESLLQRRADMGIVNDFLDRRAGHIPSTGNSALLSC